MTKFEEEFKALTSWDWINVDLIQQILTRFGNWHSDEEFQDLKSQLQQQALPVVPECVAVQIERVKNSNGNFATLGLFDWNHETKPDYTKWIHENVSDFMRACTIGYQVEKPQLFYLKHIDMSKADKECDYFAQIRNDRFEHESVQNNTLPGVEVVGVRFTQAEIDSMQIGSYEQIPVPVEDGE